MPLEAFSEAQGLCGTFSNWWDLYSKPEEWMDLTSWLTGTSSYQYGSCGTQFIHLFKPAGWGLTMACVAVGGSTGRNPVFRTMGRMDNDSCWMEML